MLPKLFPAVHEAVPGQCRGLSPCSGLGAGAQLPPLALPARGGPVHWKPPNLRGPAGAPPPPARPRRGCARLPAGRSRCGRGAAGMSEAEGGSAAAVEKPPLPAAGPGAAAAVAAAVAAAAAAGPEPGAPAEEAAVVWSPEVEVCLFHAMLGHKPVGERGLRERRGPGLGAGPGRGSRAVPAAPEPALQPGRGRGAAAGPVGGSAGPGRAADPPCERSHSITERVTLQGPRGRLLRKGHSGVQDCVQAVLEYLQEERLHRLSGQCIPVLALKFFLVFRWSFLCIRFCPLLYVLLLCTTEQSLDLYS